MSNDRKQQSATRIERRDGRLHSIQEIRDRAGRVVSQVATPLKVELHGEDIAQLVAGACVMAIPIAFTEEVWTLGSTLSSGPHRARRGCIALDTCVLRACAFLPWEATS